MWFPTGLKFIFDTHHKESCNNTFHTAFYDLAFADCISWFRNAVRVRGRAGTGPAFHHLHYTTHHITTENTPLNIEILQVVLSRIHDLTCNVQSPPPPPISHTKTSDWVICFVFYNLEVPMWPTHFKALIQHWDL